MRPSWIVPKLYPMDDTKKCMDLLKLGYTLINNKGYVVTYSDKSESKQKWSNPNRRRAYKFTNPHFWQVLDYTRGNTYKKQIVDTKSLWFMFELLMLKLGTKFF